MLRIREFRDLITAGHPYQAYKQVLNFEILMQKLTDLSFVHGSRGFCIDRLFLCLSLQFMEDISDRAIINKVAITLQI